MIDFIKEKGLPSTERMRSDLEVWERQKEQEREDRQSDLEAKLPEYTALFNRFKAGEGMTNAEMTRMTNLSGEFQKFSDDYPV